MPSPSIPGGAFALAPDLTVSRVGYGAMQLAGPHAFGPFVEPAEARRLLRVAVELGVTHVDTADTYGPHVVNQLIRDALHPYPRGLHLVTKVGNTRDARGGWPPARAPHELRASVHANLRGLGLDVLDVVNLRVGGPLAPEPGSIAEMFATLVELQRAGLIRHLGLSNVTAAQIAEARAIAPIVCVQNLYNLARRDDDALIDALAADGIAFVPYFPLGGFAPFASTALATVAARHATSPKAVALAWLLHRAPNVLIIPGTSSIAHLRENVAAGSLALTADDLATLAGC